MSGREFLSEVKGGSVGRRLSGLTHAQALARIARENEGVLRIGDAMRILRQTGLSKAKPGGLRSSLHHFLAGSEDWEHFAPGTFRLVAGGEVSQSSSMRLPVAATGSR